MPKQVKTTKKCDWGCGQTAQYYFPYSKKYCCGHNVSKCPAKNKKMVETRMKNGSYKTGAKKGYETKKSTVQSNGKTILENSIDKFKDTLQQVVDDGMTIANARAKKMVETRRSIVNENGEDLCKVAGKKQKETKDNTIINGMNMHQIIGQKSLKTNIKNGLFEKLKSDDFRQKMKKIGKELHEQRKNDIDNNGLDHYARRTKSLLEDIDENGLNAIERAQKKILKSSVRAVYKNTNIHYQCSHEYYFLETIEKQYGLEWVIKNVTNGEYIKYWNPIKKAYRYYIPDFIVNDVLYEIKSSYTWNNHGNDNDLEMVNVAKLNAAKDVYDEVRLILDKEEILWN